MRALAAASALLAFALVGCSDCPSDSRCALEGTDFNTFVDASFAREDRAKAIGAWSALGGVAAAVLRIDLDPPEQPRRFEHQARLPRRR